MSILNARYIMPTDGPDPSCELRISLGGDGYIDSGDITFTWS